MKINLFGFLILILFISACQTSFSSYPNPVYDNTVNRVSDFENNYFVKVLPGYSIVKNKELKNSLITVSQISSKVKGKYLFIKKDRLIGFFRFQKVIQYTAWREALEQLDGKLFSLENSYLIKDIINKFKQVQAKESTIQFRKYQDYLLIETTVIEDKTNIKALIAIKPYAVIKGGAKESMFVSFMFALPAHHQEISQKQFEALLKNTVVSYFLNYERSLDRSYTFN